MIKIVKKGFIDKVISEITEGICYLMNIRSKSDGKILRAEFSSGLSNLKNELSKRISTINKKVKGIDSLSGTVDSLSGTVDSLSGTVNSLSGTVNSLSGTVDSLSGTVEAAISEGISAVEQKENNDMTVVGMALGALQSTIDTEEDGSISFSGTNYLNGCTSIKQALIALDRAIANL